MVKQDAIASDRYMKFSSEVDRINISWVGSRRMDAKVRENWDIHTLSIGAEIGESSEREVEKLDKVGAEKCGKSTNVMGETVEFDRGSFTKK